MDELILRRREMVIQEQGHVEFGDYVQDDLLLWFDGINNTRRGHRAVSPIWEDLSGNGHNMTYLAANVIGPDYFQPTGGGATYVALSSEEKTLFNSGTLEVVLSEDYDESTAGQCIVSVTGNTGTLSHCVINSVKNSSLTRRIQFGYNDRRGTTFLNDGKPHYYNSKLWVDGVLVGTYGSRQTWSKSYARIGAYSSATNNRFHGKIHALRFYGRALTAEEMTQNWLEDKRRFGIGEE